MIKGKSFFFLTDYVRVMDLITLFHAEIGTLHFIANLFWQFYLTLRGILPLLISLPKKLVTANIVFDVLIRKKR